MKNVIGSVLLLAALATGNPVVETIVNEFGFDGNGLGWVELHAEPLPDDIDMHGWLLTTNTSVCTLHCFLPGDGFLVVDSASLARGEPGSGTFRLDPAGDTIRLSEGLQCWDEVVFPALPADWGRAPMPPGHASASLLNVDQGYAQAINWYIDSTPTPEWYNDDYSTVTGIVTWAPGRNFYYVEVTVCGPMGSSVSDIGVSGDTFQAPGLGAGRYEVYARGWPGGESVIYPESVDVGYCSYVPGINLDFDPQGLEESREPTAYSSQPTASVLSGASGVRRLASSVVYDAMGRRVRDPKPGVYFVREEHAQAQAQAQAMRKVIIQR